MNDPIKVVAVSGGFDPVHIGHVRLFNEAKKLGDKLVVILNNDNWIQLKKGRPFMPEEERKEVIEAFDAVDEVILTSHTPGTSDYSICEDLRQIRPHVFANGGDRKDDNIPEYKVCEELGIEMIFNVGEGGKVQSSSWLTKAAAKAEEEKEATFEVRPWGRFDILESTDQWKVKRITVNAGQRLSYQRHQKRQEHWFIVAGEGHITLNDIESVVKKGEWAHVPVGTKHRVQNKQNTPLVFIEIQTGDYFGEDDIERFQDDYGRTNAK